MMTTNSHHSQPDISASNLPLAKQSCTCWRGLTRSLIACHTCQAWSRLLTRSVRNEGDYAEN